MKTAVRLMIALICSLVWTTAPLAESPPSVNARMKVLASQLGLNYGKRAPADAKRISVGEFLERLKPLMTEAQYKKFAVAVESVKDKELPDIMIEANNLYLKEGEETLKLQVGRDPEALISIGDVSITNAEMEDVNGALKKIEGVVKAHPKNAGLPAELYHVLVPQAEAWLWPVAIIAAAGLLGYFLYKGLSNVNVKVSGSTTHEITGGTHHTIDTNHRFGIFNTGTR